MGDDIAPVNMAGENEVSDNLAGKSPLNKLAVPQEQSEAAMAAQLRASGSGAVNEIGLLDLKVNDMAS